MIKLCKEFCLLSEYLFNQLFTKTIQRPDDIGRLMTFNKSTAIIITTRSEQIFLSYDSLVGSFVSHLVDICKLPMLQFVRSFLVTFINDNWWVISEKNLIRLHIFQLSRLRWISPHDLLISHNLQLKLFCKKENVVSYQFEQIFNIIFKW